MWEKSPTGFARLSRLGVARPLLDPVPHSPPSGTVRPFPTSQPLSLPLRLPGLPSSLWQIRPSRSGSTVPSARPQPSLPALAQRVSAFWALSPAVSRTLRRTGHKPLPSHRYPLSSEAPARFAVYVQGSSQLRCCHLCSSLRMPGAWAWATPERNA